MRIGAAWQGRFDRWQGARPSANLSTMGDTQWLKRSEVARILQCSTRSVYRYQQKGELNPQLFEGEWRFDKEEVDKLAIKILKQPAPSEELMKLGERMDKLEEKVFKIEAENRQLKKRLIGMKMDMALYYRRNAK
jgi:predicted site-specific integrase-resolvase